MPSGKSPFIIDHDDATILPVLPEKIIDMKETPIKTDLLEFAQLALVQRGLIDARELRRTREFQNVHAQAKY
jgi:hypothetical protein